MGLSIPSSEALPGAPLSCQIQPLSSQKAIGQIEEKACTGIPFVEWLWEQAGMQSHWRLRQRLLEGFEAPKRERGVRRREGGESVSQLVS